MFMFFVTFLLLVAFVAFAAGRMIYSVGGSFSGCQLPVPRHFFCATAAPWRAGQELWQKTTSRGRRAACGNPSSWFPKALIFPNPEGRPSVVCPRLLSLFLFPFLIPFFYFRFFFGLFVCGRLTSLRPTVRLLTGSCGCRCIIAVAVAVVMSCS